MTISERSLHINGSHGEGGGQILRTSLALSIITQTPIRITRIRSGRKTPGLLRQHLTAVRAAAAVCGATVAGDAIGSTELTFTPGPVVAGDYDFAVGTAGSATLVLQTILPALILAPATRDFSGTDVPSVVRPQGGSPQPKRPLQPTPVTQDFTKRNRNLPHWEQGERTYFVTFRLHAGELTADERQIVVNACQHWHGDRMDLVNGVVMPDHVHLLLTPRRKQGTDDWHSLAELMHSIKGFTAHAINKHRSARGTVWQDEFFDHMVRHQEEKVQKWDYIRQNPCRKGLVERAADYPFLFEGDSAGTADHGRDVRATEVARDPDPKASRSPIQKAASGTDVPSVFPPPAEPPTRLTLSGGTHNPYAPPFDFLTRVYLPHLRTMGVNATATLERHGFYPAGGGRFTVDISPAAELRGIDLTDRGDHIATRVTTLVANLPESIGERELKAVRKKLDSSPDTAEVRSVPSPGPGNVVLVEVEHEHACELFVSFGEHGRSAERVARHAAQQARRYLNSAAAVGEYGADQLLLPMALAAHQHGETSTFTTYPLSKHTQTQIELIPQFLPHITIAATERSRGVIELTVHR